MKIDEKIWSLIGKIAAVLGILTGIIFLIIWFNGILNPEKPILKVSYSYSNYYLSPDLIENVQKIITKQSQQTQESLLNIINSNIKSEYNKKGLFEYIAFLIADSLRYQFKDLFLEAQNYLGNYHTGLNDPNGFIELEIRNIGNKQAESIVVNIPVRGTYIIEYEDNKIKKEKFDKSIEIEKLNPKTKLNIMIWTETPPRMFMDEIKITQKEGSTKIYPVVQVCGRLGNVIKFINEGGFLIIIPIILLILLFTILFILERKYFFNQKSNPKNIQ